MDYYYFIIFYLVIKTFLKENEGRVTNVPCQTQTGEHFYYMVLEL